MDVEPPALLRLERALGDRGARRSGALGAAGRGGEGGEHGFLKKKVSKLKLFQTALRVVSLSPKKKKKNKKKKERERATRAVMREQKEGGH